MSRLKRDVKELVLDEDSSLSVQVIKMRLEKSDGTLISDVEMGEDCELVVEYVVRQPIPALNLGFEIHKDRMSILYSLSSDLDEASLSATQPPGQYRARVPLPTSMLKEGEYAVD